MIKIFYQEDIINRLGAIFTFGINNVYSYKTIEEVIINSSFVNALENNEYDINLSIENVVEDTYKSKISKADISFKGLYFGESYFKLFLHYNRSFEYLFLYWPLSKFIDKYNVYHEMDFSSLRKDFEIEINNTTLLKKLSIDRHIKLIDVSKLTGISENTIDKYSRDDKYLNGASFDTIYKLSLLFKVKQNIFATNLAVYLDQSIYLFDKSSQKYRSYLGFYFASYYDSRINEKEYVYDEDNNIFSLKKEHTKIIVVSKPFDELTINFINNIADKYTYIVIIPTGFYGDESHFYYLKETNCLDVFVLTQEFVYIVKKNVKKDITDTINRSLIIKANRTLKK